MIYACFWWFSCISICDSSLLLCVVHSFSSFIFIVVLAFHYSISNARLSQFICRTLKIDIWTVSNLGLFWRLLLQTFLYTTDDHKCYRVFLGFIPSNWLVDSKQYISLTSLDNAKLFSKRLIQSRTPSSIICKFLFLQRAWQTWYLKGFKFIYQSVGLKSNCFPCISWLLMTLCPLNVYWLFGFPVLWMPLWILYLIIYLFPLVVLLDFVVHNLMFSC